MPALIGGAAVIPGISPLIFRSILSNIFWDEKDLGRLADDLAFLVSEDGLGSRIPGFDQALDIGRKDRIVCKALGQQAHSLLARAKQVFRPFQFAQVAYKAKETDDPSVRQFIGNIRYMNIALAGGFVIYPRIK